MEGVRKPLFHHFIHHWNHIINVGIYPTMPYIESRRTKLLNLLTIPGGFLMLIFAVLNIVNGRYVLGGMNLVNLTIALTVMTLHKHRMYLSARLILIGFSVTIYTLSGLYFHNGAEYYLLIILIATILIYDKEWVAISLSSLIIVAFMSITLFPQPPILGSPVPREQVWSNIVIAMLCIIVVIVFFKHIQSNYQREIDKQRQALLVLNKDQEKLFSIVAHDIRSPLATLENLLEMFENELIDRKDMKKSTGMLHEKVTELRGTLDNMLRWSTRNMQGIQTTPQHFLLFPLVTEVLKLFDLIIHQKRITVDIQVPLDKSLYADRDQVSVILRNLFSNAIKFSFEGDSIGISAEDMGTRVAIHIRDQGIGMDAQGMKSLFASSQQPAYGTAGERGSGLGLLLSSEFSRLNSGTITVESRQGEGTTFTVTFLKGKILNDNTVPTGL